MTQSGGQGDERRLPAAQPPHEGVVLPAGGGEPWIPGGPADQAAPAGGQPWGQPWGPQGPDRGAPSHPQPPVPGQDPYGQLPQSHGYGQPQPPAQHQPLPPAQHQPQHPSPYAQPLPPEAAPGGGGDADATQYIAPVPSGPVPSGPAPGGLPPESAAGATQYLGHGGPPPYGHQQPQHQQPYPPQQPPAYGGDAEATQYIPPVPGGAPYGVGPGDPGDRQPPAEFDNLFRHDESAGATQQMPGLAPPAQQYPGAQQAPPAPPSARPAYQPVDEEPQGRGGRTRKRPHVTLIAAVVAGCAVVGLGAGALMSGGDNKDADNKQPVAAASSPAGEPSQQAPEDPAKPQAEALDKLLADSNNSRAAVIDAVEKTKNCKDLDQAVTDLKDAARQRRDLVTRLQGLSVDKLPDHQQLTTALTKAWQASASADDHYAAWAGQAKNNKKVCKHGKARTTTETQQATARSGEASKEKQQAARLWNVIASKWELTRRTAVDL
ncbi:hypothetical protein [Streptomyces sp. NPDC014734]|uniref:hypothetical protein n=1 Tax=Streptomyces sp. NPDC014734 TaxID=3364886 RepID=UPI0036F8C289